MDDIEDEFEEYVERAGAGTIIKNIILVIITLILLVVAVCSVAFAFFGDSALGKKVKEVVDKFKPATAIEQVYEDSRWDPTIGRFI